MKRMALNLFNHYISVENPIMVIDFLTSFVMKANAQKIFEAQALVALPSFLKGFAKIQNKAGAKMVPPEENGIFGWP